MPRQSQLPEQDFDLLKTLLIKYYIKKATSIEDAAVRRQLEWLLSDSNDYSTLVLDLGLSPADDIDNMTRTLTRLRANGVVDEVTRAEIVKETLVQLKDPKVSKNINEPIGRVTPNAPEDFLLFGSPDAVQPPGVKPEPEKPVGPDPSGPKPEVMKDKPPVQVASQHSYIEEHMETGSELETGDTETGAENQPPQTGDEAVGPIEENPRLQAVIVAAAAGIEAGIRGFKSAWTAAKGFLSSKKKEKAQGPEVFKPDDKGANLKPDQIPPQTIKTGTSTKRAPSFVQPPRPQDPAPKPVGAPNIPPATVGGAAPTPSANFEPVPPINAAPAAPVVIEPAPIEPSAPPSPFEPLQGKPKALYEALQTQLSDYSGELEAKAQQLRRESKGLRNSKTAVFLQSDQDSKRTIAMSASILLNKINQEKLSSDDLVKIHDLIDRNNTATNHYGVDLPLVGSELADILKKIQKFVILRLSDDPMSLLKAHIDIAAKTEVDQKTGMMVLGTQLKTNQKVKIAEANKVFAMLLIPDKTKPRADKALALVESMKINDGATVKTPGKGRGRFDRIYRQLLLELVDGNIEQANGYLRNAKMPLITENKSKKGFGV